MPGFKADLRLVCGCPVHIVGKTQVDLLANLSRHVRDVHETTTIPKDVLLKLNEATSKI